VLDSDHFKQFLDHVPVAIAVAELKPTERVIYANLEFERLSSLAVTQVRGQAWSELAPIATAMDEDRALAEAVTTGEDRIGRFRLRQGGAEGGIAVDAWANVIEDEAGAALFRLVALVEVAPRSRAAADALGARVGSRDTQIAERDTQIADRDKQIAERDMQLRELQHRVKNNLQLITSLIRIESYNVSDDEAGDTLDRLAGRVDALSLLYRTLSEQKIGQGIDLGIYLSQVASAVMRAHAVEGIRLDLKVDSWPVSIDVAMPTGLVVNEVLTNALKHAFVGRAGGTITLHSLVDSEGCRVSIADDGIGLPPDTSWPTSGRLGALIVQSLRQNAGATVDVTSSPASGLRVTIRFARADAAPDPAEGQG
jgi:two-component sensor histidine kinase